LFYSSASGFGLLGVITAGGLSFSHITQSFFELFKKEASLLNDSLTDEYRCFNNYADVDYPIVCAFG
jgi:hypothetical protein